MARTALIRQAFPLAQFKALDEAQGTFEGYLAVFRNEDLQGDVIESGAFSKTLGEAKARKTANNGRYVWPILWQHLQEEPIGGFLDAREDTNGLYVQGELDLNTELGRRAYSGMKRGYLGGMSIGYYPIKHKWIGNVRHLAEIQVFEGSIVTVPANPEAQIVNVKSASGKSDWPLGDRQAAWDGGAAHKRIVAWATADDGTVDVGKLKSVHFWSPTGDDAEDVSKYKLLFCDVQGSSVKAMPKGIFACAGSHGVESADIPSGDVDAVKSKIAAYYRRMASEFDDDSIVAPWEQEQSGGKAATMTRRAGGQRPAHLPQGKAQDFQTTFTGMMQGDTLQREWAKTFDAFVSSMWSIMLDAKYPYVPEGETAPDPQDVAQANIDAFAAVMSDLVQRSIAAGFLPQMDDDQDSFYDPDLDDDCKTDYMSLDMSGAQRKAGRMMSSANHREMGGMLADMGKSLKAMQQQHKAMQAFHAKLDPNAKPDAADDNGDSTSGDAGASGGGKAIDPNRGAGAGQHQATTLTGNDDEEAGRLAAEIADMQRFLRERRSQQPESRGA